MQARLVYLKEIVKNSRKGIRIITCISGTDLMIPKFLYCCVLLLSAGFLVNCAVPSAPSAPRTPLEKPLSLTDPLLKSCVFQPQTRIAHFPMYHFPPSGEYKAPLREKVSKSQFQLLHTILTYFPNVAVFDEHVTTNVFGPGVFEALQRGLGGDSHYERADGKIFYLQERFSTARSLFHGGIPSHYDRLGEVQKEYLFQTGASMTLYFLGYIRQLHKVIDFADFQIVLDQIQKHGGVKNFLKVSSSNRDYYVFGFREQKLKLQVIEFFNINPAFQGLALIAYGAHHDFKDDFAGYFFEENPNCLQWDRKTSQPVLAFPAPLIFRL